MKQKNRQIGRNMIFIIMCAAVVYPFLLLVSVSFSSESDIAFHGYQLIPKKFDFSSYKYVFKNPKAILDAYKVTFIFSVVSMALSTMLDAMIAYPLSRKYMVGRGKLSFYLFFTMLFGGGLVPTYILNTQYLHLDNTIWIYIIPGLISPWYVFMMRTFFSQIPYEISESVLVDGGNEYTIFFQFILPLSKPVLATVALFTFLGKWNSWYESMLYITKSNLFSLQYLLQEIMNNVQLLQSKNNTALTMVDASKIPTETVRMAMAVIVAGPALIVFPFFQKYFVQGLTIGSVKG